MSLVELTKKEESLYSDVIELYEGKTKSSNGLSLSEVYSEYKIIHQKYAEYSAEDIEFLKRGLFIQWYALSEPNYLTGISELDENNERKIIINLKNRIDKNQADNELLWMLNYYLEWDYVFDRFKNIAEFKKDNDVFDLRNVKMKMINRGQMGIYWNSIIEK
ncbi:MAG: hypothetical protein HRT69_14320 [Flavobacteriaceae bacterium]|nr:hypothetical protein [Flavobacteriaceae bacterium]